MVLYPVLSVWPAAGNAVQVVTLPPLCADPANEPSLHRGERDRLVDAF
jgi:hypothetical protein